MNRFLETEEKTEQHTRKNKRIDWRQTIYWFWRQTIYWFRHSIRTDREKGKKTTKEGKDK